MTNQKLDTYPFENNVYKDYRGFNVVQRPGEIIVTFKGLGINQEEVGNMKAVFRGNAVTVCLATEDWTQVADSIKYSDSIEISFAQKKALNMVAGNELGDKVFLRRLSHEVINEKINSET